MRTSATPEQIDTARASVLETIGHLQALALFSETPIQKETALKLAARLTSVLPLIERQEPKS